MIIEYSKEDLLSFEDIRILIEKYSRLNKKNYAEILSKDFDGETWKKEGIKIMSYVKVFEVLKTELEDKILTFEKEGNLDMLNEAQKELKKANIEIIPIIEKIKKIAYYFEVKFKKIGKFKNTYFQILMILKDELAEKRRVEELCENINKKYLNIQKNIKKVANEYNIYYYFENNEKKENLINSKDKENEFIIEKREEEIKKEEKKEEEIRIGENKEKVIKVEEINEEEFKKFLDEKCSLEKVKNWLIKNWFIFIFFLFFFMIGFLIGKI